MRIWNLSSLGELGPTVVATFQEAPKTRISRSTGLKATFTVAAAVVAVATATALPLPQLSTTSLSVFSQPNALIQSIPRIPPPLASLFADRFGTSWSAQDEECALEIMAANRSNSAQYDEEELLDVALANQQESFAADIPRLSPEKVARILRKRSL